MPEMSEPLKPCPHGDRLRHWFEIPAVWSTPGAVLNPMVPRCNGCGQSIGEILMARRAPSPVVAEVVKRLRLLAMEPTRDMRAELIGLADFLERGE